MLFIILCAIILLAAYWYSTKSFNYWSKRNVKHDKPIPLFGNNFRNFVGLRSWVEMATECYIKYPNEKVVGFYHGLIPELVIRDLDIARQVLNVDFAHFYLRGMRKKIEPLHDNLFHVEGDLWKMLRQKLTPAFTTGKLKNMFPLIIKCAEKLQIVTEDIAANKDEYDVRELMARFTTEFIGACGFGIEMESINDEQSMFRSLGRQMFSSDLKKIAVLTLDGIAPFIGRNIKHINKNISKSITHIFEEIRKQRDYKPSNRHDFIDILMELESKGNIEIDSIENRYSNGISKKVEIEMTVPMMVAQIFVFFAAGFETSSSATSFTLHQLAFYPEIQEKAHEEIIRVLKNYDNKLCYEAIGEMTYLDQCFKEAMRMFPSLGNLHRECARSCTLPGVDIQLDAGVKIVIPIQAIQNDEKYFDKPHEFRPERFDKNNVKDMSKYVYLPFGEGPRACIGARLGQMQSLAGLAAVLQKFRVEPSKSTVRHPEVNHTSNVVQSVKYGIPLRIVKRDNI